MPKLTNTQKRLLKCAAARDDGAILLVLTDREPKTRVPTTSLNALEARGLVERSNRNVSGSSRITAAGYEAIGVIPNGSISSKRATKTEEIAGLLRRPDGATMPEIMCATRWQAHNVHAAISDLRKRGMTIIRIKADDGQSRYCIAKAGDRLDA